MERPGAGDGAFSASFFTVVRFFVVGVFFVSVFFAVVFLAAGLVSPDSSFANRATRALVDLRLRIHDPAERIGHARVLAQLLDEPRDGFLASSGKPVERPAVAWVFACHRIPPFGFQRDLTHYPRAG